MSRFETVEKTITAELAKPYIYGESDCFFLGLAVVDALTKLRLRKRYAGSYKTLMGAQRALRKKGHKSLTTLFAEHLEPIAPAMAALGDIVILQLADGEHVGICLGARFVTKTDNGQASYQINDCIAAFRVG